MKLIPEMTVLVHDRESEIIVKPTEGVRVFHQLSDRLLFTENLFILTSATELPNVAMVVKTASQEQQLRGLFVRLNIDTGFVSQIFDETEINLNRNVILHNSANVPKRILEAWQAGAQEQLIAFASVVVDNLYVRDCALKSWKIPFDTLPALAVIPEEERANFELDEDGSYIYWCGADVHLDMEALRSAVDPEWLLKLKAEKIMYDQLFGEAVAAVRKAHKLTQKDIPTISERHIRRIEKGDFPKLNTLKKLAQAHNMSLNEYLNELAENVSRMKESLHLCQPGK